MTNVHDTPPAQPDAKEQITAHLLELASITTLLRQVEGEQQAKVEAIRRATAEALAPHASRIAKLEEQIKTLAEDPANKALLFSTSRTLTVQKHTVSLRKSTAYVVEDEEAAIAMLETSRDEHPDDATRVLAAGCLRTVTELNKTFIKDNWSRFGVWFGDYFGISKRVANKASIKLNLTPEVEA